MLLALFYAAAFVLHFCGAAGAGHFLGRIHYRVGNYWRNWTGLTACLAVAVPTFPFAI